MKQYDSLAFNPDNYSIGSAEVDGTKITYRYYEKIPYVAKPNAPHLQVMNIYVPEKLASDKKAPIFFLQRTGGMGESEAYTIEMDKSNVMAWALKEGYVVVSPGARGRETVVDGVYVGRGDLPMSIIDLKAAIRYLKYNESTIPGNVEKIIVDGYSSGGGMCALLGATGNSVHYNKYLKEIGAAEAKDDIYCCIVNSPITDFAHIDIAYEWLFSVDRVTGLYADNPFFTEMSKAMAKKYEEYINTLNLKHPLTGEALTLGEKDTYTPYLYEKLCESATLYLNTVSDEQRTAWLAEEKNKKVLKWDGKKAVITNMSDYINWNSGRWMPYVGAYDGFEEKPSRESEAFGSIDGKKYGHFSKDMGTILAAIEGHEEIGKYWYEDAVAHEKGEYLINPMNFIGTDEVCDIAPIWYMRCGAHHETTVNLFLNLTLVLQNRTDCIIDSRYSWDQNHTYISDNEKEESFAFFNKYCR